MPPQLIHYYSIFPVYCAIIMSMDQLFLRVKVAAHLLGISEHTLRRLCDVGKIPAVNVSTNFTHAVWRVPISYVEEAMCGQARWKYPNAVKRQTWKKSEAKRLINVKMKEVESMDKNAIRFSNEEQEDE